ncbi:platelet glycoprotein Ib alpha chain-like [Saccostrea cucullata]|uniref:platelet glycoprotein Ib alpha chain-like n=1 Tax=Saccostrea cuccullata TaxID=36930 RepID=UPI002ECFEB4C
MRFGVEYRVLKDLEACTYIDYGYNYKGTSSTLLYSKSGSLDSCKAECSLDNNCNGFGMKSGTCHFSTLSVPVYSSTCSSCSYYSKDVCTIEETTVQTSQSMTDQTSQPTTDPTSQPTTDQTSQLTTDQTSQPTTVPTSQPTTDSTSQPTTDQTSQPTTDPTSQPTTDQTSQSTTDLTSQPTTDQTSQATTDQTSQPTTDQMSQLTTDQTSQSITGQMITLQQTDQTSQPTTDQPFQLTTDQSLHLTIEQYTTNWTGQFQCTCTCTDNSITIKEKIIQRKIDLYMDEKETSSAKNAHICKTDNRKSVVIIGSTGAFILGVLLMTIILPDVLTVLHYVRNRIYILSHVKRIRKNTL